MKNYEIKNLDENKQVVGTQTVSMSTDKKYDHQIYFNVGNESIAMMIDLEKGELSLNNENGWFDAISTEKNPTIKVSNIQMDSKDNLTFTLDGQKTVYRITGNALEQKEGSKFVPVKVFDKFLDVELPSSFLQDIADKKIGVTNLPFQMFEALSENDQVNGVGVQKYSSADGKLNMLKVGDQLYVGRGQQLIPVEPNSQSYYRIGNQSVLSFTVGKAKGIAGKQVSGIGFRMTEAELMEVASFIEGGKMFDKGQIREGLFKTGDDLLQ